MVDIIIIDSEGNTHTIDADEGISLMENIRANDFSDMAAICGGCCACCSCHIHVSDDWYGKLPSPQEDEVSLVEESEAFIQNKSRLACQVAVSSSMKGLVVTLVLEL